MNAREVCPCGTSNDYASCCQPWHQGRPAPGLEALMRSRYSAFVLKQEDYLLASWHPSTRPRFLDLAASPQWTSLQVLGSGESGNDGTVHFRAIHRLENGWAFLEEHSNFIKEDGRWYYLSGKTDEGQLKPGRNEPCPCGSGKKYKACCL